tara:strand:+ start:108 stop:482 length:375 start_codon:yes stop_codon:yes gene_type:complete
MANPSAGFGGAGTEVLRRSYVDNAGETEATILTGVANHIMTILTISFVDRSGQHDNYFNMYVDYDLGGTDCYILVSTECGQYGTFIWNDRFVLTETDKLHMQGYSTTGTASYDVWCTYIDQQLA